MTTSADPALTLTARSPEDLLALVPVVLGFVPADSAVLLTFGAAQPFHARLDLPPRRDPAVPPDRVEERELVDALVGPAVHHRVGRVAVVLYTGDAARAARFARAARRTLTRAGIDVVETLRVDGDRWWPLGRGDQRPGPGTRFDLRSHRFLAESVLHGRVVLPSRETLSAGLEPMPAACDAVASAVDAADRTAASAGPDAEEEAWVRDLVRRAVDPPDLADVARLLRDLREIPLRDAAWLTMAPSGETGEPSVDRTRRRHQQVAWWTAVVRRSPEPLRAAPASLLGFAAWQAGDGALAWCAVDVAEAADPEYSLTRLVRTALVNAVPPSAWAAPGRV